MLKRKYAFIVILIIVAVVIVIPMATFLTKKSNERSGTEWFYMQEQYMQELELYADEVDTIFSLYISGAITEADFSSHLNILQQEIDIMEAVYNKELLEHPIETGSHSYSTKVGCDAVANCYTIYDDIILMARNNMSEVDVLTYKYLVYSQEVIDNLADYMAAKELVPKEGDTNE